VNSIDETLFVLFGIAIFKGYRSMLIIVASSKSIVDLAVFERLPSLSLSAPATQELDNITHITRPRTLDSFGASLLAAATQAEEKKVNRNRAITERFSVCDCRVAPAGVTFSKKSLKTVT